VQEIRKIIAYEGLYGGVFKTDDQIIAKGRLEKVLDRKAGEVYHQVLVGSLEGKGMDYLKII
jgi:predicted nucleotidyltransferase